MSESILNIGPCGSISSDGTVDLDLFTEFPLTPIDGSGCQDLTLSFNTEWSGDAFDKFSALFEPQMVKPETIRVQDQYLVASVPEPYDIDMDALYMIDDDQYTGALKAGETELVMRKVCD